MYNPTYNEKFNLAKNFIDNKEFRKELEEKYVIYLLSNNIRLNIKKLKSIVGNFTKPPTPSHCKKCNGSKMIINKIISMQHR